MTKTDYNKNRPRIECPNCKKLITKACYNRHYEACINQNSKLNLKNTVYKLDHTDLFCKFCNKECKNKNSLTQHELRCPKNPNRRDYAFNIKSNNASVEAKQRQVWNKGLTKFTHPGLMSMSIKNSCIHKKLSQATKDKLSKVRREAIASGELTPNAINSNYVNSYIEYLDGTKKFLRSSYELILAIFLDLCSVHFTYETIRAPYIDEHGKQRCFIGDFEIGKIILDAKGRVNEVKLQKEIEAFANIGYELRPIFKEEIFYIKDLVAQSVDIDLILEEAKSRSKLKNFYTYKLHI